MVPFFSTKHVVISNNNQEFSPRGIDFGRQLHPGKSTMFVKFLLLMCIFAGAAGMSAISCVANVRGKKYDISAETVEEFSQKVESVSGLTANEQSVLFRGKVLRAGDKLEDLGIAPGDVLNVLKGRKVKAPKAKAADMATFDSKPVSEPQAPTAGFDSEGAAAAEKMLKNVDPEKLKQSVAAMEQMLNSDAMEQFFNDEAKIEEARLQMLEKADEYESMMPGFKKQIMSIATDPKKWNEAMNNTKQQIQKIKEMRKNSGASGNPFVPPPKPDTG